MGSKLYECEECKARSRHHWREAVRAAGMHCPACGSRRLELVSAEAKAEILSIRNGGNERRSRR